MGKKRLFNFTLNNYTDSDIKLLKEIKLNESRDCWVIAKEVGENGTPHLQGAFYFKNARSFASVQKKLPKAHICESRGHPADVLGYCCKGESNKDNDNRTEWIGSSPGEKLLNINQNKKSKPISGWRFFNFDMWGLNCNILWNGGVFPKGQGSKNVFADIVEDCDFCVRNILQDQRSNTQSLQFAHKYLEYLEPPRNFKTEVIVCYGPTGRGKDHFAKTECGATFKDNIYHYEDMYNRPMTKSSGGKWWFGYDNHEDVILSDFRDSWFKFGEFLNILEGEYVVETKNGNRQFRPKRIFITCPNHPNKWYKGKTGEDRNQLLGRISKIIDFNGKPCQRIGCIENDTVQNDTQVRGNNKTLTCSMPDPLNKGIFFSDTESDDDLDVPQNGDPPSIQ